MFLYELNNKKNIFRNIFCIGFQTNQQNLVELTKDSTPTIGPGKIFDQSSSLQPFFSLTSGSSNPTNNAHEISRSLFSLFNNTSSSPSLLPASSSVSFESLSKSFVHPNTDDSLDSQSSFRNDDVDAKEKSIRHRRRKPQKTNRLGVDSQETSSKEPDSTVNSNDYMELERSHSEHLTVPIPKVQPIQADNAESNHQFIDKDNQSTVIQMEENNRNDVLQPPHINFNHFRNSVLSEADNLSKTAELDKNVGEPDESNVQNIPKDSNFGPTEPIESQKNTFSEHQNNCENVAATTGDSEMNVKDNDTTVNVDDTQSKLLESKETQLQLADSMIPLANNFNSDGKSEQDTFSEMETKDQNFNEKPDMFAQSSQIQNPNESCTAITENSCPNNPEENEEKPIQNTLSFESDTLDTSNKKLNRSKKSKIRSIEKRNKNMAKANDRKGKTQQKVEKNSKTKEVSNIEVNRSEIVKFSGPYVHIENGAQVVINTPLTEEITEKQNRIKKKFLSQTINDRNKIRSLHVSTLSHKYDADTTDVSWMCVFCKLGPHKYGLGDLFGPFILSTESKEFQTEQDEANKEEFISYRMKCDEEKLKSVSGGFNAVSSKVR